MIAHHLQPLSTVWEKGFTHWETIKKFLAQ
jgi:hypothetical protein